MSGIFHFLKKNKEEHRFPQIQVEATKTKMGIQYQLYRENKNQTISLPLQLSIHELKQQQNIELLEILEGLWFDELLEEQGQSYLLPHTCFSQLPSEVKQVLGIPFDYTKFQLKLGHEGAVGTPNFKFVLEKNYGNWRNLERTAKQIGPWVVLANQTMLLMDPEQYEFQLLLEDSPHPKDKDKIFSYVAKVRNQAKKMKIPMDSYLEKQEYLFVDQLELDVEYNRKEIRLKPKYKSTDNVPETLLDEMGNNASIFATGPHHQKIFVDSNIYGQTKEINQTPSIKGIDIPRFVENPEAFLPDLNGFGIDLSIFSERVKSLGIQVYRAQPYVHAHEKERGWFDLDFGFSALDDHGEKRGKLEADEITKLVQEAKEKGEDYVEWNGQWLKIPSDADSFIEATNKIKEDVDVNTQIDVSKLPYILEIFENINQLEFNQPIIEAHQEMRDLGILDSTPPQSFLATLKPFQTDGFVWMKSLYYRRIGGLLADDMGLGKTIQVVSLLSFLQEKGFLIPSLIVVPKTLIENWEKEIHKFAPLLFTSIRIHRGTQRMKDPNELKKTGITITTYQTLVKDQLIFGQVDWQAVICDEAQAIKNPSTSASRVIKAMKARFRLALTGTPVENSLSELWSIMDYVQPGLLGSLSKFKQEFINKLEEQNTESDVEQKLISRIHRVYKRRTKSEELANQLPPKNKVIQELPLGKVQLELYKEVVTLVGEKMMDGLQAIQRLKALSSHPALVNEKYLSLSVEEVPKLAETMKMIEAIRDKGEKVLIFTEYIRMQDILRKTIRDRFEINPMVINGMTNRRQQLVDLFNQKPGFDAMILSPKAAGTGLTITGANHVIHYTRWWNPAVENQATDRVYRIGQEKPVFVYYPIVTDQTGAFRNGTVEQIVHQILLEKQELATSVIIPSKKINIEDEILQGFAVH